MHWSRIIFFIASLYLFIKVSQYAIAVKELLKLRFKKSTGELKKPDELPEYIERLLPGCDQKLQNLGFSFMHLHLLDTCFVNNLSLQWNIVYFNQTNKSYASVIISPLPDSVEPLKVEFCNIFSDGNKLITLNGMKDDIIGEIPDVVVIDPYAPTLEEQYMAHINKLKDLGRESITLNPKDFLANEIKSNNDHIDSLIRNGFLKSKDQLIWQLSLLPAIKQAFRILGRARKKIVLKAAQQKAAKAKKIEPVEIPVEVEVETYLRLENILKPPNSGFGRKLMVFLVSLTIGIIIFRTIFSFDILIFVVAALIVHELGHYIAMFIFGYSDRQILFLPFGAATLGRKPDAPAWQKMVVYLLGPALGLVVGSILAVIGARLQIQPLVLCGAFFIILNYINLLPITPLDGGKLLELALFSKIPVIKSVFLIASLSVISLAAIVFRDPILIIVTVLMLLGVKIQVTINSIHSKINRKIKIQQIMPTKENLLPEIFLLLKQKKLAKLSLTRKYTICKNLLGSLLEKTPDTAMTVFSLLLYGFVLALPILIVLSTFIFLALKDAV